MQGAVFRKKVWRVKLNEAQKVERLVDGWKLRWRSEWVPRVCIARYAELW